MFCDYRTKSYRSMKAFLLTLVLVAATPFAKCADVVGVAPEDAKQVEALLDDLPSQRTLWRYLGITKDQKSASSQAEIDAALAGVRKAHELVPKLRSMLKVGTSVFAYPSLLAHGDITYVIIKAGSGDPFASAPSREPPEYGYRLYVGLPIQEGIFKYDFEVLFDSKGIIQAINGVDWKK